MAQPSTDYTARDIQVLEGLEAVRRRPSMYIGSTDQRGLHHLVYEIVDNSVDEAMAGFCDRGDIAIHASGGLHGVGAAVVNALSQEMWVEVRRDGKVYRQEYQRGVAQGPLRTVGDATGDGTGTTTGFLPDSPVFPQIDHPFDS